MDAPIFPTVRDSEESFRSPDLLIMHADEDLRGRFDNPPTPIEADLTAGHEYLIEKLTNGWAWRERREGDGPEGWRLVGIAPNLPPYVPQDGPTRVVKNKVAWHMISDRQGEAPSGVCEP